MIGRRGPYDSRWNWGKPAAGPAVVVNALSPHVGDQRADSDERIIEVSLLRARLRTNDEFLDRHSGEGRRDADIEFIEAFFSRLIKRTYDRRVVSEYPAAENGGAGRERTSRVRRLRALLIEDLMEEFRLSRRVDEPVGRHAEPRRSGRSR